VDEWQMPSNVEEGVLVAQQTSLDERIATACEAADALGLSMPTLVDGMDNVAADAFAAWPERLVVIDGDGRIAHQGAPGPFGFAPEEAEEHLVAVLDGAET
jgi:iodothyronine deiodinase-like protein